jgi:excinuclease UvrABC nuclease subunit
MRCTEEDLRRVLKEWSAEKNVSPALEPSAHWEIIKERKSGGSVPDYKSPGCYVFYMADRTLWYVGKSANLGVRPGEAYFDKRGVPKTSHDAEYVTLQTIKTNSVSEANDLECFIYLKLKPLGNKKAPDGCQ